MVQTRSYVIYDEFGEELVRRPNPRLLRQWWRENKPDLPPGKYKFKRTMRQYTFGNRGPSEDWKDRTVTIRNNQKNGKS